jgi:hypothetical protein
MRTHRSISRHVVDVVRISFFLGAVTRPKLLTTHERLPRTGTTYRKCMSGIRRLARKAYVSCISGFLCSVYIDSNHRDSRI